MSFNSHQSLPSGTLIALKVLIAPVYFGFTTFAEIVQITDNQDDDKDSHPHTLHVSFKKLAPSDRQLLARHILQRQIQLRRDQRQNDMH